MTKRLSDDFRRIHHATCRAMARLAFAITRSRPLARDVCQEAYTALLVALRSGSPIANARAWVRRVVTNKAIDAIEARKRTVPLKSVDPAALTTHGATPEADPELDAALAHLPADQRQAVLLHALEGHSCRQVADVLECSKSQAGRLIRDGLAALRRALVAELDGASP
jgi:RNA polymerase sigma-70 factor (ECF subfamily)